jgi:hypothetical protein
MARKILHLGSSVLNSYTGSRFSSSDHGFKAYLTDRLTGEELFSTAVYTPYDGRTSIHAAISIWKKVKEEYGDDIDLDYSGKLEITKTFLDSAINPKEYFAVLKYKDYETTLEIHIGNKKLPLYRYHYKEGMFCLWNEMIERVKGKIKRFNIKNIDYTEAPSLKEYIK